ncbi:MAG TPA: ATP-binding cassette domain-containing protein [Candidatus Blautia intestinigallinarum]|nr:ATP-binding cassette domain-containing protein [Candidatus Blautia intestinigallinarum]
MNSKAVLEVEGLSKEFDVKRKRFFDKQEKLRAVQDVSLTVLEGETLGIVGESGCGKSTLGRLIMRLIEPTAGKICLDGEDLTSMSQKELRLRRKDFQMIFQDPYAAFNPRMTVQKILEEPLQTYQIPRDTWQQKISEILEVTGISPDFLRRYPHEFSGGQRQRISIARAILLNPKLIVADEPVSALDVSIQAQILNLMKELQKTYRMSMIFISHNLASVQYVSDRVAVMYLGRIVEVASSSQLYESPMHPYTQALIAAIPVPVPGRERKDRLSGEVPSPIHLPKGCAFHLRCPYATKLCEEGIPPLLEREPGHFVACRKYEKDGEKK